MNDNNNARSQWLEGYFPPDMDEEGGWKAWLERRSASDRPGWIYFSGGHYTEGEARAVLAEFGSKPPGGTS